MSSTFSQFPKFTKLSIDDKDEYEKFIHQFPPCGTLTFGSLMTWWSALEPCKVARHGDNLVISLWYPGYEEYSGLSVVGLKNIDETICAVFDFQRERGQEPRVSHVPEFVASRIRYPEMFQFEGERDHDECIVDVQLLSDPAMLPEHKRWKVQRFLSEFNEERMQVRSLDLTSVYDRDLMLEKIEEWKPRGGLNTFAKHDEDCLREVIRNGREMGYEALGLFLDNELEAYVLTYVSHIDSYGLLTHARFSYSLPYFTEIATYQFAKWFESQKITQVNIDSDTGYTQLRQLKLSLGPANFLRMYTIVPST